MAPAAKTRTVHLRGNLKSATNTRHNCCQKQSYPQNGRSTKIGDDDRHSTLLVLQNDKEETEEGKGWTCNIQHICDADCQWYWCEIWLLWVALFHRYPTKVARGSIFDAVNAKASISIINRHMKNCFQFSILSQK